LVTADTTNVNFASQSYGTMAGLIMYTYNTRFELYLKLNSKRFFGKLTRPQCATESFPRRWNFIGLTYDPVTSQAHARCNDYQVVMTPTVGTATTAGPFIFGRDIDIKNFLLDDIVYLPRFSDDFAFRFIQNKSKLFVVVYLFHGQDLQI